MDKSAQSKRICFGEESFEFDFESIEPLDEESFKSSYDENMMRQIVKDETYKILLYNNQTLSTENFDLNYEKANIIRRGLKIDYSKLMEKNKMTLLMNREAYKLKSPKTFSEATIIRRGFDYSKLMEMMYTKVEHDDAAVGKYEKATIIISCGESFYNPYIPGVIEKLDKLGMIEDSDGARVIFVEGINIPLIAVKRDGGYNYFTTDLASLWYRLNKEKLEWIVYVTDIGQQQHFDMLFKAFRRAGWLPRDENAYPKCTHIGFGLVLGEDGKRFRSRSSEVVRLVDLLDEAKRRCKTALLERVTTNDWSEEEIEKTSEAIGYGAVKYADLKINRLTNYTFNFDQMLNDKGNTAVYLLYAHARICSIIRKSGKDIEEVKRNGFIVLDHEDERLLGLHLLQFPEVFEEACTNLLPSVLCEYLYNLAEIFTKKFYSNCQVVGSPEETSRLLLCEATLIVMRKCFYLLGIEPVYKL